MNFLTQIRNIVLKLGKNQIIILGKGSSADNIRRDLFNDYIVIGINDAEKIVPCQFTIFQDLSFVSLIKSNGYLSGLYLSPYNLDLNPLRWTKINYKKLNQNNIDLVFKRLSSSDANDFFIEEILFISALKLSKIISDILQEHIRVYMVGFDFDTSKGYSKHFNPIPSNELARFSETRINPQYYIFQHAMYVLKDSNIDVIHIGNQAISKLTSSQFNSSYYNEQTNFKTRSDGILVVAELTTNHFGDRERLKKMVQLAKEAGADFVKVQKRDVESFYSQEDLNSPYISPFGKTFRDYRQQLELSFEDFVYLDNLSKEFDIPWFASVLDKNSFEFILRFNPVMVKIPSTVSEHTDFLHHVLTTFKGDLIISTGMTNLDYIDFIISKNSGENRLYLMHTNSSYPTPLHEINIGIIELYNDLSKTFKNIIPAYSSHDNGALGSVMAIAAGARMIEKHVKIGNNFWAHFDSVALDLENDEFKSYVKELRIAEIAFGSKFKVKNFSENHKYSDNRKTYEKKL